MATLPVVKQVKLGSQGFVASQQGLGCMGMSAFYGPAKPDKDMIELIHHAVAKGVTLLDTADIYGPYTNEILVGKAVKGIREKVQICTKFAIHVDVNGGRSIRGDPEYVRSAVEGSLKRLDVDYIDLYYQHRVDISVPIEVTVGELKKLVEEGKVKYIGLSEASSADIRRAHAVHPITAVQLEWSLWSRDIEEDVVATCRELGIGIVAYSPLGRGFFSGIKAADLTDDDYRKTSVPRFNSENEVKNLKLFECLKEVGQKHGHTPGQVALAWVHHNGDDVVAIPGTTKIKNLEENIGALDIKFSKKEIQDIEAAVPHDGFAGDRYISMDATWRFSSSCPLSEYKKKP